jgi:hypothetical protein
MAHVSHNTGNNEHYTPPAIIEMAREVLGEIDLDPASNEVAQQWVRANTYYTKENSGLDYDWTGKRIWLNPPYSRGLIEPFIEKLIAATVEDGAFICLTNNFTETAAGQKLLKASDCVCFPSRRIRFIRQDGSVGKTPLQGQMITYCGNDVLKFAEIFSTMGEVF